MPIGSYIAIYFVVWWICLFMILPIGARSQAEAGDITAGTEPGAPVRPLLWWRILGTSVLAALVMALLLWGLSSPLIKEYWS